MKLFIVLFAIIAAALAAPQFGGFGASGSAANAGASSQTFNQGGGFGYPGAGFSGSSANAAASSQSFNAGGGGIGHGSPYGGGGYGHGGYPGGFHG